MSDDKEPAFTSLTEIGDEWGLTNRAVGDLLANDGYKNNGRPTKKALDEGLAVLRFVNGFPTNLWSRDRVGTFLEQLGRDNRRTSDGPPKELFLVVPLEF